jgi:hypothetical protein
MRSWSLLRLVTLVAVATIASCGDDDAAELERQAVGVYALAWVNGEAPPYPMGEQEGHLVQISTGRITLRADRTCEYHHSFELYSLDDLTTRTQSETEACTWSASNNAVHLRFPPSGSISGLYSRDALWFDYLFDDPMRFVYERSGS